MNDSLSLINAHIFPPSCLTISSGPRICTCQAGTATSCSNSFSSIGYDTAYTYSCIQTNAANSSTLPSRTVISSSDSSLQPIVITDQYVPSYSKIAYTDISNSTAYSTCSLQITSLEFYSQCQFYVDITGMLSDCTTDVLASIPLLHFLTIGDLIIINQSFWNV